MLSKKEMSDLEWVTMSRGLKIMMRDHKELASVLKADREAASIQKYLSSMSDGYIDYIVQKGDTSINCVGALKSQVRRERFPYLMADAARDDAIGAPTLQSRP